MLLFIVKIILQSRMLFCLFKQVMGKHVSLLYSHHCQEFCILLKSEGEGSSILGRLQATSFLVSSKGLQKSYSVSS